MRTLTPSSLTFGCEHPVRSREGFSRSRLTEVQAETHASADITLVTAEGDKVTLSAEAASQAAYTRYDARGRLQGQRATVHAETLELTSTEALSVQIEGDLSAEERADIQQALGALGKLATDFFEEREGESLTSGFDLGDFDTLRSVDATLEVSQSLSVHRQSTQRLAAEDAARRTSGRVTPSSFPEATPHTSTLLQTILQALQGTRRDVAQQPSQA